jgi:hypothetical protein
MKSAQALYWCLLVNFENWYPFKLLMDSFQNSKQGNFHNRNSLGKGLNNVQHALYVNKLTNYPVFHWSKQLILQRRVIKCLYVLLQSFNVNL